MPTGPYKTEKSLKKYLKEKNLTGNPFFYAIYSKRLQTYCGLASYLRIKPQIGTIEVGWISYAPNLQGTAEGTEAMYLMMQHKTPDHYILASGKSISLKEVVFYIFDRFKPLWTSVSYSSK